MLLDPFRNEGLQSKIEAKCPTFHLCKIRERMGEMSELFVFDLGPNLSL